jgi:hypothetical protein
MKSLKYIWLSALAVLSVGMVACNDDDPYFDEDNAKTTPVVNKVYLEDVKSSVPDREVTYARLGQMIRLEGSGFIGIKNVYVNGYDTYFNRAYVSDNSMLVTLNAKTPVADANPEVRNTIRLVKDGVESVCEFEIRAASPSVTSVSNTLPPVGERVVVFGGSLQEISKVTLPGGVEVTEGIVSDDEDGEWFSFVMPSGVTEGGAIVAVGANGIAQTPDYFNNRNCMILDFDGAGTQGYWSWKEDGSMINADDLADDPEGKYGKCWQVVPDRLLNADGGVSSGKPRVTECWTAGNDDELDDWTRMTPYIAPETSLTKIALQFEINVPEEWGTTGQIEIALINNFNWAGYGSDDRYGATYFYIPWLGTDAEDNPAVVPFKTEGWQTVTIPLSELNKYKTVFNDNEASVKPVFQDVINDRNDASYRNFGMGFVNTDFEVEKGKDTFKFKSTAFTGPKIYVDNWRIVPYEFVTISDYPEDEETK